MSHTPRGGTENTGQRDPERYLRGVLRVVASERFMLLTYRWTPTLLRIETFLACASLLVLAAWIVGTITDMDKLVATGGILVAAVLGVAILPLVGALLIKNYVAAVYALRMVGELPAGAMDPKGIRRELVLRARLVPPPE